MPLASRPSPAQAVMVGAAALAALLVLVPIASLVQTAFSSGTDELVRLSGTILPGAVANTLLLLAGVALVAGAIGAGTAWLVTAFRFPGSHLLSWLLPLPLAVPPYVAAFIYVELLDAAGPVQSAFRAAFGRQAGLVGGFPEIRSLPGCILVMSLVLYPYVFVPARAAFLSRGRSALEAARALGGRGTRVFWRVAMPMARPAIVVGISLALLETLSDIGATEFLGVRTLTLSAYNAWLNRGDLPAAAQIACIALLAVTALIAIEWRSRKARRQAGTLDIRSAEPIALTGRSALAATLVCVVPIVFGLVLPVAYLAWEVVGRDLGRVDGTFVRHLATTLGLASAATLLILLAAVAVALSTRAAPRAVGSTLAFLSGLGYALPGTVLVLGLFGPLVALDGALAALGGAVFGTGPGLIVTGSLAGLVIAYLIRFLRVASGPLAAQLEGAGAQLESAARVLGAGPMALARHVQLPLMRPALGAAALLVFIDCVKELPATVLLRPLNVETMATLVYGAAARGSFQDGAAAALAIVAACLVPVMWLTRITRRGSLRARALGAGPA